MFIIDPTLSTIPMEQTGSCSADFPCHVELDPVSGKIEDLIFPQGFPGNLGIAAEKA
jgi:hypothetical protein